MGRRLANAVAAAVVGGAVFTVSSCGGEPALSGSSPSSILAIEPDLSEPIVDRNDEESSGTGDVAAIERIVMIGDSITVASQPELETALSDLGFDDVTIESVEGKRMAVDVRDNPSGAAVAEFLAGGDDADRTGELWIVALGTNDITPYASIDEMRAAVEDVVEQVPAEVPLIWIDTYFRDQPDATADMNAAIRQALAARARTTVVRWSAVAQDDGVLSGDGVHPSSDGTGAFASLVAAEVDRLTGA